MVPLRVLSRINLADTSRRSAPNPRSFNALRPLKVSWLSFSDSRPLFSIACSLFLQIAGGWVSRPCLWTIRGDRRRLPVTEMQLRDNPVGVPQHIRATLCFRRHMRHVAPLSPLASVDCAYFSSPRGCVPRRASDFPGAWMRSQPAFRSPLATRCAPLLP